FSVNFLVFAAHWSSSPCTKRFQRSRRSLAPFSGVHFACANASGVQRAVPAPRVPAVAAPAVVFRKSLLLNFDMFASPPIWFSTTSPTVHRTGACDCDPEAGEWHRLRET